MSEANAILSPREQKFIALYLESGNQTQSYIAAGYTANAKSASVQASRLLAKPRIRNEVARRSAELLVKYDYDAGRIIRELTKIAAANAEDYLSPDRRSIDLRNTSRDRLAAVSSVEIGEYGAKIKLWDKQRALVELARLAALYPADRAEISGPNGGPIVTTHRIDIESLEHEQREQLRAVLLALKAKQIEAERSPEAG